MKAININPFNKTVTDVELAEQFKRDIRVARMHTGAEWHELVRIAPDAWLVIDEEGLLKAGQSFFKLPALSDYPFAGSALLLGVHRNGRGFTDVPVRAADLEAHIHWVTATEVKLAAATGIYDRVISTMDKAGNVKEVFRQPIRPDVK